MRTISPIFTILSLLLLSLILPSAFSAVLINEVMYDPGQCSDDYCEWVELYNDGLEVNLSGCFFDSKPLLGIIPEEDYFLLLRQYENFSYYFNEPINYQNLSSLRLSNSGKKLILNGTSYCNTSFNYTEFTSDDTEYANGNNYTLERRYTGKWTESIVFGGTPGRENSIFNYSTNYWPLVISEIMPNPFEEDDAKKPNGEWVELYNSGNKELYLEGLFFCDENLSHQLAISSTNILDPEGLSLGPKQLVVIYRDGDSDFNLNNNEDNVQLYYGEEFIDAMPYHRTVEGMSWSNEEGDWYLTKPTPGELNQVTEDCDWLLFLDLNRSIYQSNDFELEITVSRFYGLPKNVTVTGEITDVNGVIKHRYLPWNNNYVNSESNKVYSPNLPSGTYQVNFRIENLSCHDGDYYDNVVSRLFVINPYYQQTNSNLSIVSLSLGTDGHARWGDLVPVKINAYKGNISSNTLSFWAEKDREKISKVNTITLDHEYQDYKLNLPLQLFPNCAKDISDGTAALFLEGLGQTVSKTFPVEDLNEDLCEEVTISSDASSTSSRTSSVSVQEWPAKIIPGQNYTLKTEIKNNNQPHSFTIWSYLYKGQKCYSCNAFQYDNNYNSKTLSLSADEISWPETTITADSEIASGEYKLKVKTQRDDQKTVKEFTANITVLPKLSVSESKSTFNSLISGTNSNNQNTNLQKESPSSKTSSTSGFTAYESTSAQSSKVLPYILVVSFMLLLIVLLLPK